MSNNRRGVALTGTLLLCLVVASHSVFAAQLIDLRLGRHEDRTRLVLDLSGPVTYTIDRTGDATRVVVAIADVEYSPVPIPPLAATPIEGIDIQPGTAGAIRMTLELSRPVDVRSFLLPPELQRGDRLVLDLYTEPYQEQAATVQASTGGGAKEVAPVPPPRQAPRSTSATTSPRETVTRSGAEDSRESGPELAFSGTWEQEWAYQTRRAGNQKFEALVEPRLDVGFESGASLVAIARVRLDAVGDLGPFDHRPDNYSDINGPIYNDEYAELSLRELYLDTRWAGAYWRLGKQQVVWGQADGIKVLDVVNPQSFREFILDDFDDSRIPLWMVNAEIPLSKGSLQLLWIPDTTYHELAEQGSSYFLTSPKWVPNPAPGQPVRVASVDTPDNPLEDSDVGARYSAFVGGWDITLNYMYRYQDFPVLYQTVAEDNLLQVDPTYKRSHLVGSTLSNAFDSFTLRAEIGYSTDTYHTSSDLAVRGIRNSDELGSVLGLDWQYSGSGLLSGQWFYSYLPDYESDIVRDRNEHTLSLLFQQGFANDAWQLRVLGLYSVDDQDSLVETKLKYWLRSNLEVWVGGDIFHGTQRGTFGQFDEQSRVLAGFEYGF